MSNLPSKISYFSLDYFYRRKGEYLGVRSFFVFMFTLCLLNIWRLFIPCLPVIFTVPDLLSYFCLSLTKKGLININPKNFITMNTIKSQKSILVYQEGATIPVAKSSYVGSGRTTSDRAPLMKQPKFRRLFDRHASVFVR